MIKFQTLASIITFCLPLAFATSHLPVAQPLPRWAKAPRGEARVAYFLIHLCFPLGGAKSKAKMGGKVKLQRLEACGLAPLELGINLLLEGYRHKN